ncbi:hypothetical protein McpAg1_04170 [Methanocorpusculaceae archaeon Ag1]|uniref:Archaeal Type IV pilin N-terminal domain-containing protein n=1 Tax=Methanorbis furvi TaxID=3028299 RepID=A0AAE4MC60_9EURY|nr:hypothetical protein [Methanocorpusculaceae archaeon Ag1]
MWKLHIVCKRNPAVSPVIATLLLVFLTVLIAAILLILCSGMTNISLSSPEPVPEILDIQSIHHENHLGQLTLASRLYVVHKGREPEPVFQMQNGRFSYVIKEYGPIILSDYRAEIYVNGVKKNVFISTLQGSDFIPTSHYGVKLLGGTGVRGTEWSSGQWAWIDLKDQMISEGDVVTLEIIRKSDGKVVSRSTETAPEIVRS